MTGLVDEFLRRRFVLYRYSENVTSGPGGYNHLTAPVWDYANPQPGMSVERWVNGNIEVGTTVSHLSVCRAIYTFPTDVFSWTSPAPWVVGTWEEILLDLRSRQYGHWAFYALAEVSISQGERQEISVPFMCLLPIQATTPATQQGALTHRLIGFLHEAAESANAKLTQITEVPNFQSRLKGEGHVMNEVLAVLGKIEFVTSYKTSNRYEMHV